MKLGLAMGWSKYRLHGSCDADIIVGEAGHHCSGLHLADSAAAALQALESSGATRATFRYAYVWV